MKHVFVNVVTTVFMLLAMTTKAQHKADSIVIWKIIQEEVSSWNTKDAEAYSKDFAENGTFTNIRGMFFTGHQQFLERHREIFKGMFSKTMLQQKIISFRFLSPEVAIVETVTIVSNFPQDGSPIGIHIDSKGRLFTRLLQVLQKQSGDWKVVVYHNVDLKSDTPVPAFQ